MNQRPAPNVRHASIHYGDTLQRIALRELGDASRWVELVILNDLRPPYISQERQGQTLAPGDAIKIPAPGSGVTASTQAEDVLGTDLHLPSGVLQLSGGDLDLVSGVRNLTQALRNRVVVQKQGLAFHPEFGCWVRSMLGATGGQTSARLAAFYVRSALLEDPRVQSVSQCTAQLTGDVLSVRAVVVPITGQTAELKMVI